MPRTVRDGNGDAGSIGATAAGAASFHIMPRTVRDGNGDAGRIGATAAGAASFHIMPRTVRATTGGLVHHALNRSVGDTVTNCRRASGAGSWDNIANDRQASGGRRDARTPELAKAARPTHWQHDGTAPRRRGAQGRIPPAPSASVKAARSADSRVALAKRYNATAGLTAIASWAGHTRPPAGGSGLLPARRTGEARRPSARAHTPPRSRGIRPRSRVLQSLAIPDLSDQFARLMPEGQLRLRPRDH